MLIRCHIEGTTPLLTSDGVEGLNTYSALAARKRELTRKKGTDRGPEVDAEIARIDCERALWLDHNEKPCIPNRAVRAVLEQAARKLKQGPLVREGLTVLETAFEYDRDKLGTTPKEIAARAQYTVPAVIQRNRVLVTRPRYDEWSLTFTVETDPELCEVQHIEQWLDIGGRRIGLGAWRPACSGEFGRFKVLSVEKVEA